MKPNLLHRLAHNGAHECCPKGYRAVPNVTGDPDFDATLLKRNNKDMPKRLDLYLKRGKSNAYGPLTGYDGYHNYNGDT